MTHELIHDRGRGPELVGTRITIYNLLPHFLDSTATEAYLCEVYQLTSEQVAAARAYVLNNPDTVLAQHLRIEKRIAAGNPPEVVERLQKARQTFGDFKSWLARRAEARAAEESAAQSGPTPAGPSPRIPSFREWFAARHADGRQTGK